MHTRLVKPLASLSLVWCLAFWLPPRAVAWGGEGHRIIAQIALWRLRQQQAANDAEAALALQQITQILASQPESEMAFKPRTIEEAALWPDRVRRRVAEYNFANNLHFVSILLDANVDQDKFDRATQCQTMAAVPEGNCVVGALEHFQKVLAAPDSSRKARLEALSFVVHFLGDLHQPLHTAEDAAFMNGQGDRGGNNRRVFYLNRQLFNDARPRSCFDDRKVCIDFFGTARASKNLHAAWDKYMLLTEMAINERRRTEPKYVADLVRSLPANPNAPRYAEIESGNVVEWAEQAHDLAEKNAYRLTGPKIKISPADGREHGFYLVSKTYRANNIRIVDRQLLNAGIRLAAFLKQSFANNP